MKTIGEIKAQADALGLKSYEGLLLDEEDNIIAEQDALLADLERAEANGG